jgi:CAAX protease family protein
MSDPEPPPRPFPFWDWSDLALLIGLALPCLLAGALAVKGFVALFRVAGASEVVKLVPAQFLGYLFLFLCMKLVFRAYGEPFWRSLGWRRMRLAPGIVFTLGMALAFAVALAGLLLKLPADANTPMHKLLSDRTSALLVAAVGVTLGPLCEELIFRGFMQPLFVKAMGTVPGILLAAVPFGLLHLQQYGFTWQSGLLITLAGAAFGWMRHLTGSTKASTLMHAAYNCAFLLALLAQKKDFPHTW